MTGAAHERAGEGNSAGSQRGREAVADFRRLKAPSGFEPLSGVSTVSTHNLSEALAVLTELLRHLRDDGA